MDEWLDYTEFSDRVEELIELGLHEEAEELLERYRDQYSCYWEYWFFSAQIDSEHEEYERAVEELEKALEIDPGNAVCKQNLFSVLRLMEREEEALEYIQKALEEHPKEDFLINSLLQYYIDNAEYKKALLLFRSKAGLLKDNPEGLKYAGAAYYYLGQYEEALKFLKRAYKRDSESSEIRDMLADVLLALGYEDDAVNLYYEFLKRSPKNVYIMSKLISIFTSIRRYQEAKSEAEKLKEYFPRSAVGYVNLAYVYLNSGDPDNALLEANTALNIDSGSIEGLRAKAGAYLEKGYSEPAYQCLLEASGIDPDNVDVLRDMYYYYRTIGNTREMFDCVNRVIELEDPYCLEEYIFLADYYKESGKSLKAFRYLHKAYRLMPREKELLASMADLLISRSHHLYAGSLLYHYIESRGWDSTIFSLYRGSRLKSRNLRESIRFLRFCGEKNLSYRRFIFKYYSGFFSIFGLFLLGTAASLFLIINKMSVAAGVVFVSVVLLSCVLFLLFRRIIPG